MFPPPPPFLRPVAASSIVESPPLLLAFSALITHDSRLCFPPPTLLVVSRSSPPFSCASPPVGSTESSPPFPDRPFILLESLLSQLTSWSFLWSTPSFATANMILSPCDLHLSESVSHASRPCPKQWFTLISMSHDRLLTKIPSKIFLRFLYSQLPAIRVKLGFVSQQPGVFLTKQFNPHTPPSSLLPRY